VEVVPEPIALGAWKQLLAANAAQPDPRRFTVLAVCRFYRRKRLDVLLRAVSLLRSQVPELRLRLVGAGPEDERLRALAWDENVTDCTEFIGNVSQAALARELNGCDVFCLPTVQESFGMVFLEAMAAGKPIVAARAVSGALSDDALLGRDPARAERRGRAASRGGVRRAQSGGAVSGHSARSTRDSRVMMNPAEFGNIAAAERDFWWYRGMRLVTSAAMQPFLAGRGIRRVLEAGCGTGYYALELENQFGWEMFPADLGAEGLAYARRMGLDRLSQADVAALPYCDGAFDAVVSMDVIVHFPRGEEHRPACEMARVLRPGGLLVVRVSALDALRSRHSEFAHERQRFTRARLVELLRGAGLRVLRATYANSLLLPVAFAKFRLWEPLTGQAPSSGVQPVAPWLDRALHAALAAEARWIGRGGSFPLGQSLIAIAEKPDYNQTL
jgi:SAM-dependent methyltransferase